MKSSGTADGYKSVSFLKFSTGSLAIKFKRMMRDAEGEKRKNDGL